MSTQGAYPLRSYGFGLRLNLFNYAILRWDYAVPVDQERAQGGLDLVAVAELLTAVRTSSAPFARIPPPRRGHDSARD